jgi:23S rRNA pseudouridine1911/1915/1917 synthase
MYKEYLIKSTIKVVDIDHGLGHPLSKFVYQVFKGNDAVTHSAITRWIKSGLIRVNSNIVPKNYHLLHLDLIQIAVPNPIKVQDLWPLDVVYEDEHLMIINKSADLSSHGSRGDHRVNLTHIINNSYAKQAALPRSGIVNRLDKDTTGLMIVARTIEALESLQDMMRARAIDRRYLALVHGVFELKAGTINFYMKKDHTRRRMRISKDPTDLEAITHYKVLHTAKDYSLVECKLATGRTHQIRVHMAGMKHPVVADRKYSRSNYAGVQIKRQALHAHRLNFIHPVTKKEIKIEQALSEDMAQAWALLEKIDHD